MKGIETIWFFSISVQKVCINVHAKSMIPKYTILFNHSQQLSTAQPVSNSHGGMGVIVGTVEVRKLVG